MGGTMTRALSILLWLCALSMSAETLVWTQPASNNVAYWVVSNSNNGICHTCRVQSASVSFAPGTNRFALWAVSKWGVQSDATTFATNAVLKTVILK